MDKLQLCYLLKYLIELERRSATYFITRSYAVRPQIDESVGKECARYLGISYPFSLETIEKLILINTEE